MIKYCVRLSKSPTICRYWGSNKLTTAQWLPRRRASASVCGASWSGPSSAPQPHRPPARTITAASHLSVRPSPARLTLTECFTGIDVRQAQPTRLEWISRLFDHISLAPVDFELIEKVWLAIRDLIQREQPKEVGSACESC